MFYRVAEAYLFDTCTMKCGYCWLAESGRVLDASQLVPFRDLEHLHRLAEFFNSRVNRESAWLLQFTGGEPLVMPNLDRFCEMLGAGGNKVAFYTSLGVDFEQRNFQSLLAFGPTLVDYVMASFHPEAERDEAAFFEKIEALKKAGHKMFVRFVGHPARLDRLDDLAGRCERLDVAFYPTTLLTDSYPDAYSDAERARLEHHFASLSQFIQLRGGVDTRKARCWAGSRVIAVNFQTGNITPCISIDSPSIGNIFEDRLDVSSTPGPCYKPGIACICDVHYQQNVVLGAFDAEHFQELKSGFAKPRRFENELATIRSAGFAAHGNKPGIGRVADDQRLYYGIEEVKQAFKRGGMASGRERSFQAGEEAAPLFRLNELVTCNTARIIGESPLTIVTPEGQWSYAAVIPVRPEGFETGTTFILRVEFSVENGAVGIGCVGKDFSTYVGERERGLIEGDSSWDIVVDSNDGARWLILRNITPSGAPATFQLSNVRTFRATSTKASQI